jgi:hypothetical protein
MPSAHRPSRNSNRARCCAESISQRPIISPTRRAVCRLRKPEGEGQHQPRQRWRRVTAYASAVTQREYRATLQAALLHVIPRVLHVAACGARHAFGAEAVVTVGPNPLLFFRRGHADPAPRARPGPRFDATRGLSHEIARDAQFAKRIDAVSSLAPELGPAARAAVAALNQRGRRAALRGLCRPAGAASCWERTASEGRGSRNSCAVGALACTKMPDP